MSPFRRLPFAAFAAAVLALAALTAAGCGSSDNSSTTSSSSTTASSGKAGKVAVLLPDSKSSVRWETQDRKYLGEAFKKAGVDWLALGIEAGREPADVAVLLMLRTRCRRSPSRTDRFRRSRRRTRGSWPGRGRRRVP